jgi:hypothetical protein
MNLANVTLILQIISSALQLVPLGVETTARVKALLAQDAAIAENLAAILAGAIETDAATLAMIREYRTAAETLG